MIKADIKSVRWLQYAHFMIDCYPGFIAPLLPFIAVKINIPMATAMLIISISNITSYLFQPVFGYFADRCQKRFFIFWGMLLASIFIPLMGVAQNVVALTFAIVLGEIGVGFFHPQATSFLPMFCKNAEQSKFEMGIFLSMGSAGYGVGAMVATKIYDLFGSEAITCLSVIGVISALSMFLFVPKVSKDPSQKKLSVPLKECVTEIFSHKIARTLVFASIVKSMIISSFTLIMPFFWKSIGFSASKTGIVFCLFEVTSTIGMIVSPKVEKYTGTRNIFYIAFLSILPITLLMNFMMDRNIYVAVFLYVLIGFLAFLTQPVNVVMSQKLLPKYKSTISGIVGGFTWGIVGVMLPLLSLFCQKVGILTGLVIISCVPLIFCLWVKIIPKKPIED